MFKLLFSLSFFLVFLPSPARAQFTSARSLWGRPVCSTTPSDTQVLAWNAASGCWKPAAGSSGCSVTPYSSLIAGATTSNGSLGCGLTYVSALHTDFTAAATTQSVKLGTAASLFSAAGIRIEETTTLVSGVGSITAVQACVGTVATPCAFTPGGLALFGSTGQFTTFPGPFSAAATATATQDIYLTLTVTNAGPGNLSAMTGSTGTVTVRVWGGVAQ